MKLFIQISVIIIIILSANIGTAGLNHSETIKISLSSIMNSGKNDVFKKNKLNFSMQNDIPSGNWEEDYFNNNENNNTSSDLSFLLELAGGLIGGITFGIAGGHIGRSTAECSGDFGDFLCGLDEALIGAGIGLNIGTSLGVKIAGEITKKKGSYASALFGSISGFFLGMVSIWAFTDYNIGNNTDDNLALITMISLPAVVSTTIFNIYAVE